jgi:hypothetical protein
MFLYLSRKIYKKYCLARKMKMTLTHARAYNDKSVIYHDSRDHPERPTPGKLGHMRSVLAMLTEDVEFHLSNEGNPVIDVFPAPEQKTRHIIVIPKPGTTLRIIPHPEKIPDRLVIQHLSDRRTRYVMQHGNTTWGTGIVDVYQESPEYENRSN